MRHTLTLKCATYLKKTQYSTMFIFILLTMMFLDYMKSESRLPSFNKKLRYKITKHLKQIIHFLLAISLV